MDQVQSVIEPLRKNQSLKLEVEEFEKDNDDNFHIDFIHSLANVRAANYKLDEMDWITVKIKAGKIVPALATTTAAIAALQTIELIRYLKDSKLEEYRNSFLNMSLPALVMSEPGPAPKIKIGSDGLEVTLWDRWEYQVPNRNVSLLAIVEHLESTYKLFVRDIYYDGMSLFTYNSELYPTTKARNQALSSVCLLNETHSESIEKDTVSHVDLVVTFVDPKKAEKEEMMINTSSEHKSEKILEDTPLVRVYLPQK